jgi:hypothetical protein
VISAQRWQGGGGKRRKFEGGATARRGKGGEAGSKTRLEYERILGLIKRQAHGQTSAQDEEMLGQRGGWRLDVQIRLNLNGLQTDKYWVPGRQGLGMKRDLDLLPYCWMQCMFVGSLFVEATRLIFNRQPTSAILIDNRLA